MRRFKKALLLLLVMFSVCVAGGWLQPDEAYGLPTFARKYKTGCATCHEAYPRLNGVGESFRMNGYKFADDEMYIKEEPVEMADEAYKDLWPKSIWPSDIPGLPPISLVLESQFKADIGGTQNSRTDFDFPNHATLLGAGSFGDKISFLVEIGFSRGGGHHGGGGAPGVESDSDDFETDVQGWIQFEDLFELENMLNLKVGSVGMQEIGLFTHRGHNRFTANSYLYGSWAMPGLDSRSPYSFEDTSMFMAMAQPGIELNGFGRNWRYALGIVNGNGDSGNDDNSEKDFFLQLAYKFGGLAFDGSTEDEEEDLMSASSEAWRDNSLTVSLFGYKGTAEITTSTFGRRHTTGSDFWRLGAGVLWRYKDLQFGGGYMHGHDDDPYGILSSKTVDSDSWFVESSYFIFPWLIPTIRYETLRLDLPRNVRGLKPDQDRSRLIVGVKALLRANVFLTVEGRFYTKDQRSTRRYPKGDKNDDDQIISSLNFAF